MRKIRLGSLCAAILVASTLLGGLFGDRVLAGGGDLSEHLRLYTAILSTIEDEYVEEVDSERLVASSIREMLRMLDPHSNFLQTREYSSLQERQRGSYYGLGITVQSIEGNITVVSPFEGTPAHRLGIRAGDVISRIEGDDARGLSIDDAVKRLRGPKGSPIQITILRPGYERPLEFTVIRDEIPLHSVPYSFMVDERTAYVRLVDFNETTACRPNDPPGCANELEVALDGLLEQGADSVILDIRDNPGGLLDQAFAVSNLFLNKGQLVVFTRGRTERDASRYVTERDSRFGDLPLVVLVSKHSASASEIVAGAIQDHDRGLIVGEPTFGKGLVQTIMPLRNVRGYALALTTARYYTPSGRSIQRDYGETAFEDYVSARGRAGCGENAGDAKLTDAGREVFGGDGIAPDVCIVPERPSRFVASMLSRQVFGGFSNLFASAERAGQAEIEGTGSRPDASTEKVTLIQRDFAVDDAVMKTFADYLTAQEIPFTPERLEAHREELSHHILAEVLRQTFGEGEARRRSTLWDPQLRRAIELIPRARALLDEPDAYVARERAEEEARGRVALRTP
jgi:carboxyl-terminal processing protease